MMIARRRKAAAAAQRQRSEVAEKNGCRKVPAGGILASLNGNIPIIKDRKGGKSNTFPSSVMVSRIKGPSSPFAHCCDKGGDTILDQEYEEDLDDDLSAISCNITPQRLHLSPELLRNQQANKNFSEETIDYSASEDLNASIRSQGETSNDPLSSPHTYVTETSGEVSSYDPEFDDDEYNPEEDDESDFEEDLEFEEEEVEESPKVSSRHLRRKSKEKRTGYVQNEVVKTDTKRTERNCQTNFESSVRTIDSDDESTIVEPTPRLKSRSASLSIASPEIQLAEVVSGDCVESDNDLLVATIVDSAQMIASEQFPKEHLSYFTLQTSKQDTSKKEEPHRILESSVSEIKNYLIIRKGGNSFGPEKRAITMSSSAHLGSDTHNPKHPNKSSQYTTPTQRKPKNRRKSFYRQEGRVKRGKWTLGAKIGIGSFGVVHVGMNRITGALMAVKIFKVDEAVMKDVRREVELLRSLKHQNIVQYLGAQMDKTHMHIFQEWVPGGSVASMLSRFGAFPLQVIQRYLSQALLGLQYLHDNNIMHRDIKGSNILINDEGIVKLADFGASKNVSNLQADLMMSLTVRGTPYFMAPEVFEERYSTKADIWAIGCVAYQMIAACPPWKDQGFTNPISLFNHIKRSIGPPPLPHLSATSLLTEKIDLVNAFDVLLKKCFEKEPSTRPSAQELLACNFFREIGSDVGDDDSHYLGLFSPDGQTQSPWSLKHKESIDNLSGLDSRCKSPLLEGNTSNTRLTNQPRKIASNEVQNGGRSNGARCSEMISPQRDSSEWPEWAKAQFGKQGQNSKSPTTRREMELSNRMDSLALSEDSTQRNPFASTVGVNSSVLVDSTTVFSDLLGLQLIDQQDRME